MTKARLAKQLILLGAVAGAVLVFFFFGWNRYFSLEGLRTNERWLRAFAEAHLLLSMVAFVLAYVGVVAFSLPGATVMTIAGGLVFGLWVGASLSVLGATVGAIILFVLARYVVGDALRARGGPFLTRMAQGFERNAFSYLLFLRLVPLFPFWAVNLAPALLEVPLRSFALATLIGIIPGTLAYASIGDGLSLAANVSSRGQTGEIFSPTMIAIRVGFALLALVPLVVQWLRRRRARPQ